MPLLVQKLNTFTGHRDGVYALESANNDDFFSAAADGWIVRWNLQNTQSGDLIAKVPASVYSLCYLPENQILAVAQNYEGIHLIDIAQQHETHTAQLTKSAIFDLKHTQNKLFVACGDGKIIVLNATNLSIEATLQYAQKSARCLALHPTNNEIAIGFSDNFIRVIDLNTLQLKYAWEAHQNSVFSLAYSPDGNYLFSGSRDAHLKIWKTNENYALREKIVAHLFTINHIVFSPDGNYFATCSKDKTIKLWDLSALKLLKVIDRARHAGHASSVNKLLWNKQLISASDDRTISVWEIQ